MPHRPPSEWFSRCTGAVSASRAAADPDAVCGATWKRKSRAQKRAAVDMEPPMKKKKKAKKKAHRPKAAGHRRPKKAKKARPSAKHREMAAFLRAEFPKRSG